MLMIVLVLVLAQTAKAATAAIHASMLGNDIAGVGVVLHFSNGCVVQNIRYYPMDIGYWTILDNIGRIGICVTVSCTQRKTNVREDVQSKRMKGILLDNYKW